MMDVSPSRAVRLVLLTSGAGGDPRAAWFEAVHAGDLVQVAGQGGFHLVEVTEAALRSLDPELAAGQLMGPGRPCPLPLVRRATFDALIGLPPILATPRQVYETDDARPVSFSATQSTSVRTAKRTINLGSVVLASEAHKDGWWEAEVLAVTGEGEFVLRWRDFPGTPEFRKRFCAVCVPPAGGVR